MSLATTRPDLRLHDASTSREGAGRVAALLASFPATPELEMKTAVLTTAVDLIARGAVEDYDRTVTLDLPFGRLSVAQVQNEFDVLGTGASSSFTTATILNLSRTAHILHALRDAGLPTPQAHRIATECADVAFWLLLAGVNPGRRAPMPESPGEMRWVVENRGTDAWRPILANIAANPFGPDAKRLADLARAADLPVPALAIERCARVYLKRCQESERREVATEIKRLVAVSGCSQHEFARHVGTSGPRLSTYVTGGVTPSAAMMLRIARLSATLARRASTAG